jgi:hypothetical protein
MRKLISLLTAALVMAALAVPVSAQEEARIHLIHGIPDTPVGDTQDLSALAGETLVGLQVRLAGTETVAIDAGDTPLPASGNYTIIAHLDEVGTPTLAVFENDSSSIDAGEGRLVVREMEIPGAREIGLYRFGPVPGESGSAVLAAHIAFNARDGVFRDLDDLEVGGVVEVSYDAGSSKRFRVTETAQYAKDELPIDRVFAKDGAPELTVVAYAEPIDG